MAKKTQAAQLSNIPMQAIQAITHLATASVTVCATIEDIAVGGRTITQIGVNAAVNTVTALEAKSLELIEEIKAQPKL